MGYSFALVTLIVGLGLGNLFFTVFKTFKFDGEPDYPHLVLGVVGALIGFCGIQSGLNPDYSTSLAIIGVVVLLYAWNESRDALREAQDAFLVDAGDAPAKS